MLKGDINALLIIQPHYKYNSAQTENVLNKNFKPEVHSHVAVTYKLNIKV
jgi:hypothetical protein